MPHPFRRLFGEKGGRAQVSPSPIRETHQWRRRDYLAAAFLFCATATFVAWQNSRVAVLWDLGYLLDTSWRIALGQMPYRDFPLAHAPLTFLIQTGLMRVAGRHFFLVIAYAATAGGLASVLTWRILLRIARGSAIFGPVTWLMALLMAAPLAVIGIYSIYPHPIYDCDCILAILLSILLLIRLDPHPAPGAEPEATPQSTQVLLTSGEKFKDCHPERSAALRRGTEGSAVVLLSRLVLSGVVQPIRLAPLAAGAATVLPLFFKQNIGLPFLAVVAAGILILFAAVLQQTRSLLSALRSQPALILTGILAALLAGLAAIAATAGLGNYIHWTIQFAAQRRMPGWASMLTVYNQAALAWMLPALAAGLILCHTPIIGRLWARIIAFCLVAAPFAGTVIFLFNNDEADERADTLLTLWPLLLLAALLIALFELRRGVTLQRLVPFFILAAIHGALLSQQLWGSTYALWPLLMVLAAFVLGTLPPPARPVAMAAAAVISATLLVCGTLYSISRERLSYVQIPDAPLQRSSIPAMRGIATPGPFLSDFD
ncbi:MAG TPA: hypothetical protein VGL00_19925, partial [Terracidiphilus sp.]